MGLTRIHIGKAIQADLKEQGRSVVWFAKQMNCSPQNAFSIFKRETPSLDICRKASLILGRDYISILVEETREMVNGSNNE